MGKSGRKHVQTEKLVKSDQYNDTPVLESKSAQSLNSTNSELEARLQRLENSHVNGKSSSDVYKFAFFFFMGVALTIIIYPKVSSTINPVEPTTGNVLMRNVNEEYTAEQLDEIDDTVKEEFMNANGVIHKVSGNHTHQSLETTNSEDLLKEQEHSNNINPISEVQNENKETYFKDSVKPKAKPVEASERVEDLMIGETDENDNNLFTGQSFKFVTIDEEDESITVNEEDSEPQTVELFSTNVEDIKKDEPIGTTKLKDNKKDTKLKRDSVNSKASIKKESKSKAKASTSLKEDKDEDSKIPKEIRDFKPTYQKTLAPKKVFIDGRRIPPMELLPQKPNNSSVKIWLFEEFLSEHECDNLMRVHKLHTEQQSKDTPILCFDNIATLRKHLNNAGKKRVKVSPLDFTQGTTCVNATFSSKLKTWLKGNWSYSTAFYPGESQFATVFEQRVKQAMGLLPENGGKFQITSYPSGIGYKSHTDCTDDSDKRDRVATVLVYLDTVVEGGETDFPELGVWVRPRKGRALLWNNMNPDGKCEPMSIHKANKVADGHKYILQRWYYYQSFYSLGKRPPEPPLPQRNPGQPRVSCDEFEHGSCRWYDEWNFDHVIEYERQKYTLV